MGKKQALKPEQFLTIKTPMPRLSDKDFAKLTQLRRDAGWLWNSLVSYHAMLRRDKMAWPSMQGLAMQMTGQTAKLGLSLGTQSQNLLRGGSS